MTGGPRQRALANDACAIIGGRAVAIAGDGVRSHNPANPAQTIWSGSPRVEHVDQAVEASYAAQKEWARWSIEKRAEALRAYKALCQKRVEDVANLICDETGKAFWDSKSEAELLAGKVDITLTGIENPHAAGPAAALSRVSPFEVKVADTRQGICRFRPHGVMGVIGPFNFPAHLPNGHIVPALLLGNAIVFKPSDKTPAVGQLLAELLIEALDGAGAPAGLVNLVQGGADVASRVVSHPGIDGILFTGSWPVGRRILEANLDRPGRIVALELGGNNPTIVMPDADLRQAAIEVARASFVTTGQRCTCSKRLVVHEAIADRFIPLLMKVTSNLIVGHPRGEGIPGGQQPFMGPMIRAEARDAVLGFQKRAVKGGGRILIEATAMDSSTSGHFITPGLLEVPRFSLTDDPASDAGCDVEVFGPLLRVSRAKSFDDALAQANATNYGLASAIFTRDPDLQQRFLAEARAGCVNINTGTAGASGKLPFGGLGHSGNHRPAGSFSVDYCAFPVASLVESGNAATVFAGMHFDDKWLA